MSFTIDKQTLDDLNILGRYKGNSIFNLFDHTHTRGGTQLLESLFQDPLSDAEAINFRSSIFQYFQANEIEFPIGGHLLNDVEHYLTAVGSSSIAGSALMMLQKKLLRDIASDKEYDMIHAGMVSLIEFLNVMNDFFSRLDTRGSTSPYQGVILEMKGIFSKPDLKNILSERGITKIPLVKVIRYDHLLRYTYQHDLKRLMQVLYEADIYITVAKIAAERKFVYAKAVPFAEEQNGITIAHVFHPQLPGAVANNVHMDHEHNLVFLTGANMAGKSTFMKSFGIAVYLAHMGFPVAAENMTFSVQDGMYTSINVPDNLSMGYSHFYAEVLRVKHIAEEVGRDQNLVIIFDELFKGTNVKDAYDATVAITEAFAENSNCCFIVSTHIVEAGQTLQERSPNMEFVYFPTILDRQIPTYTYKLEQGISSDRHGMMIITNEGIVDIIKAGK
jgi:DNA mismatch repair protein MutS